MSYSSKINKITAEKNFSARDRYSRLYNYGKETMFSHE